MQDFVDEGGRKGYTEMYLEILEIYQGSFKQVLMGMRVKKGPVLFHCTGMYALCSYFSDFTDTLQPAKIAQAYYPPSSYPSQMPLHR